MYFFSVKQITYLMKEAYIYDIPDKHVACTYRIETYLIVGYHNL
jgi:hypothetical protein